jgi:hypothetical protein
MRDFRRIEKTEAKQEANDARQRLQQLRDEIRVRIHLGGMELRETFERLEREADHLVAQVPPAAAHTLNQVAVQLRKIAHALDGKQ